MDDSIHWVGGSLAVRLAGWKVVGWLEIRGGGCGSPIPVEQRSPRWWRRAPCYSSSGNAAAARNYSAAVSAAAGIKVDALLPVEKRGGMPGAKG